MALHDFPGYLGWTSRGVIAIHADWPMYPAEHGADVALRSLGQFPRGSVLRRIDDIDQSWLFVLGDPASMADPYDVKYLHVALWVEDIHELHRAGFVHGASEITRAEWVQRERDALDGYYWQPTPGEFVPVPKPSLEDIDEDELDSLVLVASDSGLRITDSGWAKLDTLLASDREAFHPIITAQAVPIASVGRYDAAVREACVALESRVRELAATKSFGQPLIKEIAAKLNTLRFITAYTKVLRGELRTLFRYVRNDYMHNMRPTDETECFAILGRVSELLKWLDAVAGEMESP